MRPLVFLIGLLLFAYVIVEAIKGELQYSFEGFIGSGLYGIASHFTSSLPARGAFMDIVYALTLVLALLMMWVGITGDRK